MIDLGPSGGDPHEAVVLIRSFEPDLVDRFIADVELRGRPFLQVPSEELLAMARKLREFAEEMGASGVLLDKEG